MRHARAAIFLLLVVPAVATAQDVEITPRLKAGDEFRLDFLRERDSARAPKVTARTQITVRVLTTGPDGSELEWIPGETTFTDPQLASNPAIAGASKAVSGLSLRLALNAAGVVTRLINEEEVLTKLQVAADMIAAQIAVKVPDAQRAAFDAMMRQVLSPAVLRASATSDVQTYFGLNGMHIRAGEPVEVATETPNPFGGKPMAATFRIRLDSTTAETASLTSTTVFDPDVIRSMTQTLTQQAGRPIPPEELAKLPPIEITDQGSFVFDRGRGVMREVVIDRRVSANGAVLRADHWTIRLVPAAAPPSQR